jgi:hypothetical protein
MCGLLDRCIRYKVCGLLHCLSDASGPKCMGYLIDVLDSEGKDLLGKQHWIQKGKDSTSGSEQDRICNTGPEMFRMSWTA